MNKRFLTTHIGAEFNTSHESTPSRLVFSLAMLVFDVRWSGEPSRRSILERTVYPSVCRFAQCIVIDDLRVAVFEIAQCVPSYFITFPLNSRNSRPDFVVGSLALLVPPPMRRRYERRKAGGRGELYPRPGTPRSPTFSIGITSRRPESPTLPAKNRHGGACCG